LQRLKPVAVPDPAWAIAAPFARREQLCFSVTRRFSERFLLAVLLAFP
jgi:hypothetical protein